MSLQDKINKVKEFQDCCKGQDVNLQAQLIEEECFELSNAVWWWYDEHTDDERLKEMCDVLYVIFGYCAMKNWNLDAAFNRVHCSNMSKLWNGNGCKEMVQNEKGKVIKSPNYKEPYLNDLTEVNVDE